MTELRDKPAGTIRLTATEFAAEAVLWPAISRLTAEYPDVKVEIVVDYGLTDIVGDRFDAGVRMGGMVAKDMIAMPISPRLHMAVGGSPAYFAHRKKPVVPQDLTDHNCISLRLLSHGGIYAWEFERDGQELNVRTDGQLTFNTTPLMLRAAVDGRGLVYTTERQLRPYFADGRLISVLDDWCEPFDGYHLYYPSRRQPKPAFKLLVDALRYRAKE